MKPRFNLKNYFCPGLNSGQVQASPRPGQARLHRAWIDHVSVSSMTYVPGHVLYCTVLQYRSGLGPTYLIQDFPSPASA